MFPMGPQYPPRRQKPPHLHSRFTPQHLSPIRPNTTKDNLLSMFKTSEGNYDLEKITETMQQISEIYRQISPMITKFKNR